MLSLLGGRSYIANLSNRVDFRLVKDTRTICLDVSRSNYLAVKTDGFGVVDIAVEEQDGLPEWASGNPIKPFTMEISQIRGADLRSLRLVRDVCALLFHHMGTVSNTPLKQSLWNAELLSHPTVDLSHTFAAQHSHPRISGSNPGFLSSQNAPKRKSRSCTLFKHPISPFLN